MNINELAMCNQIGIYGYSMGILWVLRVVCLKRSLGGGVLDVIYIRFLVYFY